MLGYCQNYYCRSRKVGWRKYYRDTDASDTFPSDPEGSGTNVFELRRMTWQSTAGRIPGMNRAKKRDSSGAGAWKRAAWTKRVSAAAGGSRSTILQKCSGVRSKEGEDQKKGDKAVDKLQWARLEMEVKKAQWIQCTVQLWTDLQRLCKWTKTIMRRWRKNTAVQHFFDISQSREGRWW